MLQPLQVRNGGVERVTFCVQLSQYVFQVHGNVVFLLKGFIDSRSLSGNAISKGGWRRSFRARGASARATIRRPAFRRPLAPLHTAPEFVRSTDPSCRR